MALPETPGDQTRRYNVSFEGIVRRLECPAVNDADSVKTQKIR
jgi:hypothetical protein